jgi:hypothetical protein
LRLSKFIALACLLTVSVNIEAIAQSTKIMHTTIQVADEGKPIDFEMLLENPPTDVEEANLFYREKGEDVFDRIEMIDAGGKYVARIAGKEVNPNGLEYYMSVNLDDGQEITFPEVEPKSIPIEIAVKPNEDSPSSLETIILSPEKNETILKEDLLIAVSLFNGEGLLDLNSVILLLDGMDITSQANITVDLISYVPYQIRSGEHIVELRMNDIEGNELPALRWNFYVIEEPTPVKLVNIRGRIYGDSRYEKISDEKVWRNKLDIKFDGNYNWLNYAGRAFITSDEKSYLQPRDRYFLSLSNSWFRLNFGDTNPMFSDLVLRGRRVRGLSVNLRSKWSSLGFVFGQTNRKIEGSEDEYGTYRRDLLGIRTSFGKHERFLFGLSLLKSKDAVNSIEYGIKPKDNIVIGSDIQTVLDERRIILKGEVAFSLYNDNIAGGAISKADLDTLGIELPIDPKDYEQYFVINPSMVPIDPTTMSSLAYVVRLKLNYFKNLLNFNYKSIGSEYNCLENSYLQNDIRGFSISDRVRFFNNQAYLMLGYENYNDNLSNDKTATTNSQIFSANISYYPLEDLPDVNLSFRRYLRNNGISKTDTIPDSLGVVIDIVDNREYDLSYLFSMNLNKNIYLLNLNHNLSITYNQFDRVDKYRATRLDTMLIDNSSKVFRLALKTQYPAQFNTTLSYSVNRNSSGGGQERFDFDVIGLHTEYRSFDKQLSAHSGVKVLFGSKTTADSNGTKYNKFDLILGGVYDLSFDQSILFDLNLAKYTGELNDNDVIIRLGYIKRF